MQIKPTDANNSLVRRILALAAMLTITLWPGLSAAGGRLPYAPIIKKAGAALRVSPAIIHAVIEMESNFDADARSKSGALGLMQLIPKFGAREAYKYLYKQDAIPTDTELLRPEVNIWLGTVYLRILSERYFGWIKDPSLRLCAVLAAYNWGPTRVLKQLLPNRKPVSLEQFMRQLDACAPRETQEYVRQVIASAKASELILASD